MWRGRPYNGGVSAIPISIPLEQWLDGFPLEPFLRGHVAVVLEALPGEVRWDLISDPSFVICDYEPGIGPMMIPLGRPGVRRPSRSVVLKRTLRRRPVGFIRWVIAHELAHAHLRNAGRHEGDDPETAADFLAAAWGFPRPN